MACANLPDLGVPAIAPFCSAETTALMQRVNIVLPDDLLAQMDQVASAEGMNRSQLVRTAVLAYFQLRAEDDQRRQRQAEIHQAMEIQDHLRQSTGSWDAGKILREQRQQS